MWQCKAILVAVVLFAPAALPQTVNRPKKPVALDKIAGGDLYALDANGAVLRLKVSPQGLSSAGAFPLSRPSTPTDLVSAKLFGQPTLLVTTDNQSSGFLTQYSLDGRVQKTWVFRRLVLGLDVDPNSHIVYIAAFDAPEIYRVNLQATPSQSKENAGPDFVAEVLGAKRLGPLVVDLSRECLYVGDIETGNVLRVDVRTHKSSIIARHLSIPAALLVSSDSNLLYIADASQRKIYVLDLRNARATPRVFASLPQFQSPTGLAKLDDGRLVVADDRAGVLFVLSPQGAMQSVFDLTSIPTPFKSF